MCFTTDIDMLQRVQNHDADAWNLFYLRYAPLIHLCGRDCGLPDDLIEDLRQEVVLAVLHGNMHPALRFRPYLRAIIRNRACTMLRRLYRHRTMSHQLAAGPEDEAGDDGHDRRQRREWQLFLLSSAVDALRREVSPLHFQVFDLMYHHGWKAGKVARFLGLMPATVYSIDRRNLMKLRAVRATFAE